jgi:hypothetical protein
MKTFSRILAVIALLWAILIPLLGTVAEGAHHGMPRILHRMAQELRSALPKGPANDTALVSLPAPRASNMAEVLDNIAEDIKNLSAGNTVYTVIQSVVIIILCVCIFGLCKKDANTAV